MQHDEETCGKELAEGAIVPEQVAELFAHVAHNLRKHAQWVGEASPEAAREHSAMIAVADGYEAISAEAQRICNLMRTLEHLPPAPHDPQAQDRQALAAWMRAKIVIQRKLAKLLNEHADQSERALAHSAG
jgi:hypothetical protein